MAPTLFAYSMLFYNKSSKMNLIYEGSSCNVCNHANGQLIPLEYNRKRPKPKRQLCST